MRSTLQGEVEEVEGRAMAAPDQTIVLLMVVQVQVIQDKDKVRQVLQLNGTWSVGIAESKAMHRPIAGNEQPEELTSSRSQNPSTR